MKKYSKEIQKNISSEKKDAKMSIKWLEIS